MGRKLSEVRPPKVCFKSLIRDCFTIGQIAEKLGLLYYIGNTVAVLLNLTSRTG